MVNRVRVGKGIISISIIIMFFFLAVLVRLLVRSELNSVQNISRCVRFGSSLIIRAHLQNSGLSPLPPSLRCPLHFDRMANYPLIMRTYVHLLPHTRHFPAQLVMVYTVNELNDLIYIVINAPGTTLRRGNLIMHEQLKKKVPTTFRFRVDTQIFRRK